VTQIVCQGERQGFRLTSLGWIESRTVYVIYVGQDIRALEQQLASQPCQYRRLPTRRP
jgi:hypothetical protein